MVSGRVYDFSDRFWVHLSLWMTNTQPDILVFENAAYLKLGDVIEAKVTDVKADGRAGPDNEGKGIYSDGFQDAEKLLELLRFHTQGCFRFSEKASPEGDQERNRSFGKMHSARRAAGHLYKERKIDLTDGKIRQEMTGLFNKF